ncbi:DUF1758 domain-containing protein [Trichonephila clavipes]|nr:DUF1758 domain-containing protein [Trichonephila clavipes]
MAKKQRLCFLCLRVGCMASKCKAKPCKLCAKRHHVSSRFQKQNTYFLTNHNNSNAFHPSTESRLTADVRIFNPTAFHPEEVSEKDSNAVFAINQHKKGTTNVFLSSVKCFVKDSYGEKRKVRGLLDVGSMTNLITKKFVEKLGLRKEKVNILVTCLNDSSVCDKNCVATEISNFDGSYKKRIKMSEFLDKITDLTSVKNLNVKGLIPENINLADDSFYVPSPIDCLLGAEIFYELLRSGQIRSENSILYS